MSARSIATTGVLVLFTLVAVAWAEGLEFSTLSTQAGFEKALADFGVPILKGGKFRAVEKVSSSKYRLLYDMPKERYEEAESVYRDLYRIVYDERLKQGGWRDMSSFMPVGFMFASPGGYGVTIWMTPPETAHRLGIYEFGVSIER